MNWSSPKHMQPEEGRKEPAPRAIRFRKSGVETTHTHTHTHTNPSRQPCGQRNLEPWPPETEAEELPPDLVQPSPTPINKFQAQSITRFGYCEGVLHAMSTSTRRERLALFDAGTSSFMLPVANSGMPLRPINQWIERFPSRATTKCDPNAVLSPSMLDLFRGGMGTDDVRDCVPSTLKVVTESIVWFSTRLRRRITVNTDSCARQDTWNLCGSSIRVSGMSLSPSSLLHSPNSSSSSIPQSATSFQMSLRRIHCDADSFVAVGSIIIRLIEIRIFGSACCRNQPKSKVNPAASASMACAGNCTKHIAFQRIGDWYACRSDLDTAVSCTI